VDAGISISRPGKAQLLSVYSIAIRPAGEGDVITPAQRAEFTAESVMSCVIKRHVEWPVWEESHGVCNGDRQGD